MHYLEASEKITGYKAKILRRGPFHVQGYTRVLPPGKPGEIQLREFWNDVIRDGRLAALTQASAAPAWVLALGSWDPECPPHGQRYTICLEETEHARFASLPAACPLFRKAIGASEWLCFETRLGDQYPARFWQDNPYAMLAKLGYRFRTSPGDYSLGLHFEAYPPDFTFGSSQPQRMEFWITVEKA